MFGASESQAYPCTSQKGLHHPFSSLTAAPFHRETLDDVLHRIAQLMQDDDCVS